MDYYDLAHELGEDTIEQDMIVDDLLNEMGW